MSISLTESVTPIRLRDKTDAEMVEIYRKHQEQLAKAFGITGEDLSGDSESGRTCALRDRVLQNTRTHR